MKILSINKNPANKDFPLSVTILYLNKEWSFNARDIGHIKKKIMERVFPFTRLEYIEMDIELNFREYK